MKSALIILVIIGMTAWLDKTLGDDEIVDCHDDPSVCSDLQCCGAGFYGEFYCRSRSRENESCDFYYNADEIRTTRYSYSCPCMKGLTCVENEYDPVDSVSNEDDAVDSVLNKDVPFDRDDSYEGPRFFIAKPKTCQPDNNGLTTDLPEKLHRMQNETKPILPLDKKEEEKHLELEKNIKKEDIEAETAEIENLQFGKPGKKKCQYGRKPLAFFFQNMKRISGIREH